MNILQKISLALIVIVTRAYTMEQDNSILACVTHAATVEHACEQATDFLAKQKTERKLTTERFLLACQQKFHRSMYEIGFSLATPESLEIA